MLVRYVWPLISSPSLMLRCTNSIYQKQYCENIGRGALDIKYQQENAKTINENNISEMAWLKNLQTSLKYNKQIPGRLNNFGWLLLGMSLNFLFSV